MTCYIDTSAFLAVLDPTDPNHSVAAVQWERLLESDSRLTTSDYVLVETLALIQHRFGMGAVRAFCDAILPVLTIDWSTEKHFKGSLLSLLTAGRRDLSLADCVSFDVMRRCGIQHVLAFDKHFKEQGFSLLSD